MFAGCKRAEIINTKLYVAQVSAMEMPMESVECFVGNVKRWTKIK